MIPLEAEEYRRYAFVLSFFALGLYAALLVASFGMLSLLLDREVIEQADAGPLLGPVMVAAAVLSLWFVLWARVGRTGRAMQTVPVGLVLLAALLSYLFYCGSGALFYALNRGGGGGGTLGDGLPQEGGGTAAEPISGLLFLSQQLGSPFAVAVGLWAGVVALCYYLLLIWRAHGGQRPRWPWEKRGT